MKKTILLLFVLSVSFLANAQVLWKLTGNGLTRPSYLFGTHHLIPIQFLDSVPGLFKAFNASETVVGEMVLNNIDATVKIQQAAVLPNHLNMKKLVNDADYQLLNKELKAVLKLELKDISMMHPAMILTMYEMELYKQTTGFVEGNQSDSYFQLIAAEKDKKIVGLETIDQQIALLFGNGTLERQAEVLVSSIRNKSQLMNDITELNTLYKQGKLEALLTLSSKKGKVTDLTDEEFAQFVDNRNLQWMNQIPELIQKSSCFIAVGALHLPGKNGLIQLLQKKGYKVSAVSN